MRHLICLLFSAAILSSCGSGLVGIGDPIQESRALVHFEVLALGSSAHVELHQIKPGTQPKVVVRAEENLLPFIVTAVEDGRLDITQELPFRSPSGVVVEVYTSEIIQIINGGSGDITAPKTMKCKDLHILNTGSGDVNVKFKGEDLFIENSGSGSVVASGKGNSVEIDSNGSGDTNTLDLKVRSAEIANDGSGNVSAYSQEELEASLDGSGDIKYHFKGNPEDLELERDGSGQMVELTDK